MQLAGAGLTYAPNRMEQGNPGSPNFGLSTPTFRGCSSFQHTLLTEKFGLKLHSLIRKQAPKLRNKGAGKEWQRSLSPKVVTSLELCFGISGHGGG